MNAMKKDYISPIADMLDIQLDTPVLVFSTEDPSIEDFEVSDGEW